MSYQCKLLSFLATFMVTLGLPLIPAIAQTSTIPEEDLGVNGISPTQITLDPIKDIFVNSSGYAQNTQELYKQPDLIQNVKRQINWTKRIPLDKMQLPLKVTYEFKSNNGTANRLNNSTTSNSTIGVILNPLENNLIFRSEARNVAVVEGRVELTLDPTQSQIAGVHGGRLSVCIQSKDGGCL
ncbi:hypothetical protein [Calothrix sp. UHCC 0171]|uniref:hypothetical protein n=1 Tax=Calothrix sp. UHCC 0171 TaxID=3110245 RepID=UPI002B1F13CA|nr:hypothetical protein [Calothrix sp. UHCC 0171]MEA5572758.1 hypothetical protein [Calothrix sp. UHCC 0171]